jgi:hypothetical protein
LIPLALNAWEESRHKEVLSKMVPPELVDTFEPVMPTTMPRLVSFALRWIRPQSR